MKTANSKKFRIGVLGGMGPMAGVLLQRLIIEATPAKKDQDHLQVMCFTNPQIPDRTESLLSDNGSSYAQGIIESVKVLEGAGVDLAAIACNTAHARFLEIQQSVGLPLVDMVALTLDRIKESKNVSHIGLLTTDGCLAARVFESRDGERRYRWIAPDSENQEVLMDQIYSVKAGNIPDIRKIWKVMDALRKEGAEALVLGCTELSIHYENLSEFSLPVIDSLRILAARLVELARDADRAGSAVASVS